MNLKSDQAPLSEGSRGVGQCYRAGGKLALGAALLLSSVLSAAAGTFTTDFSSQPAGVQLYGDLGDANAGVIEEGVLKLTKAVGNQQGSMVIDDLDGGAAVSAFTATFKLLIGGGSGADGFSFNFGGDVADSPFGEEGSGSGLTVAFDSYDNGGGEAPAIDVKVGGTEVATAKIAPRSALAANAFLPVRINLDSDGTLDVSYGNTVIYTNLYTGFTATAGRFGFGARTGGSHDNHFIDDLSITTSTEPQTQPAHPLIISMSPSGSNSAPDPVITIDVKDFTTQLTTSSVQMKFNNATVTPSVSKTGDTTTITYDPPGLLPSESVNTIQLVYTDSGSFVSTNNLTFKVTPYKDVQLPAPLYFESFDSTAEGSLPAGWVQTNATTSINEGVDFSDANSDAYLGWTVIERARLESDPFDPRRLNVAPGYLNGVLVTNLVSGRFVYAESDNRSGNQIQMLFSPDFDLTGKSDVFVSFHSIYEQNQDSIAAVEYSVDGGATWTPIVIMLDGPDIVRKADGTVDAAATLTTVQTDTPQVDDGAGELRRTAYGEFLASAPLDALGPYIEERVNDNPIESKRIELYRLTKADNQAKVRFRFMQAGTGSWYFGIDDFGLYSIPATTPASPELLSFQFNEGNGTSIIDQASKLVGTFGAGTNAPAWTSDTPSGQAGDFALSFANQTQVVVSDPTSKVQLDKTNPSFTMQAWVNLAGNPAARQVFYYNNGPGGALSFSIFTNRTVFVTTLGVKDQSSNAKIPDDGQWHHIAVVHEDKKEFRFYVDGALADTQAYTGSVIFTRTNQVFYLGSEPAFGLQYTGKLDRLKVTKGMLTPDQLDYPAGGEQPGPKVSITRTAAGLSIAFEGTLESAENVTGPWSPVQGASPVTVQASGAAAFYRSKQ